MCIRDSTLTVQVEDAVSGGNPLTGGLNADFNSKAATCTFTITVGPEMIPAFYQGNFTSDTGGPWSHQYNINCFSCADPGCNPKCTPMGNQENVGGVSPFAGSGNDYVGITGYYFGPRQNGTGFAMADHL